MNIQIILCPDCLGWGTREIPDRQGTYDILTCLKCGGEGRLIQETIVKTRTFNEKSSKYTESN